MTKTLRRIVGGRPTARRLFGCLLLHRLNSGTRQLYGRSFHRGRNRKVVTKAQFSLVVSKDVIGNTNNKRHGTIVAIPTDHKKFDTNGSLMALQLTYHTSDVGRSDCFE
mmetsp:Transcript_44027/g.106778  ORF Transcript_44027/g.106778 Transcript_44027/m.106778 type:complete len:109 (+) Transcript_44027:2742-3068(+)